MNDSFKKKKDFELFQGANDLYQRGDIEQAPSDLIIKIESLEEKFRVYRPIHRKLHIDQIEAILDKRDQT